MREYRRGYGAGPRTLLAAVAGVVLLGAFGTAEAAVSQRTFDSAEAAVQALVEVVEARDVDGLLAIFGPDARDILMTGDRVTDRRAWERFAARAQARIHLEPRGAGVALLSVGDDNWPFPIPLRGDGGVWSFDIEAGEDEILSRRIGRNELLTIQVCQHYADLQREYAGRMVTAGGPAQYAQRVRSTPGTHDGLYWEAVAGTEASPAGPLIAAASVYAPFHGYIYRVLSAQGAHAPGGAKSYVRDGKMTEGFALVAFPAEHGETGIMTFIVNQQGLVFEKDLGPNPEPPVTAYEPDRTWYPAE